MLSLHLFRRFSAPLLAAVSLAGATLLSSCGAGPSSGTAYSSTSARYIPGPERSVLQTPCYRLKDARGRRVELTGAVHIAEKSYYNGLNRHLRTFDAVLFEGVGTPPGAHPNEAAAAASPKKDSEISRLYAMLAHDFLHLSLQVEEIDYHRPNFVHADLTAEEFDALLKKNGMTMDTIGKKSPFTPGLRTTRWLLGIMKYLVPKNDPDAMKRMAAPSLAEAEESDLSGKAYQVIVVERNRHLLEVMDRQLAKGKRNISLFYGSGHFDDLRNQLHARGWKDAGTEWRDAWVIAPEKD